MKSRLWGVWDRVSMYLPILLMGVLALGAYWLVQNTPMPAAPVLPSASRSEPDYYMTAFSVRTFTTTGKLKSEVFGEAARHFPDTDMLEIDKVRIRAFDMQDRLTTSTANRALTNGDASEVQLFGNAVVVRDAMTSKTGQATPRMEFRGEYLHAFMDTDRVTSHLPVQIQRGPDQFTADGMDYDNTQRVMNMQGRVRGTLAPSGTR